MNKLKSISHIQNIVLSALMDGNIHSSKEFTLNHKIVSPRDVIKSLRRFGYLIHNHGRAGWSLDERHISGHDKEKLVATAEAKVLHSTNSLGRAKKESERIPSAIEKQLLRLSELAELKSSPDNKDI